MRIITAKFQDSGLVSEREERIKVGQKKVDAVDSR